MITKVAISIWDSCVSPVLDTAGQLMIIELDGSEIISRRVVDIPQLHLVYKIDFFRKQGCNVLICGAVTQPMYQMIISLGIKVIPFIRGSVDNVIAAYIRGELHGDVFYMPGYPKRRRCRCRHHQRYNHLRNKINER